MTMDQLYFKIMIIIFAISMLFISCDNMVEVDPPNNQLNSIQIFESEATAEGALSALYADLQSSSVISGGAAGSGSLLGSYTDDLDGYDNFSTNAGMDIYKNIQTSSNTTVKMYWTNAYRNIYMANSLLKGLELSIAISASAKDRIKGEALFIRSLVYFYLTEIYGDIPYTTETDYTINQSLSKSPTDDVLQSIAQDLSTARFLVSDIYRNADRIYVNRKTVEILLALVHLHQKKFAEAEAVLNGIIGSPLYALPPSIASTFKKGGKHILWQLKPLVENNPTQEALLYNFSSSVPTTYAGTEDLYSVFSADDQRKTAWIEKVVGVQKNYYKVKKYRNITANTDEYSIVFRLQEAYLLMAETLVKQHKLQDALVYLNSMRQLSGLAPLSNIDNEGALLGEVLSESRREFFAERGIRFLALKRNGLLDALFPLKPNWSTFRKVWPIPVSELILNPSLNPQNFGY